MPVSLRFAALTLCMLLAVMLNACGAPATTIERKTSDGVTFVLERPAQPITLRDYQFVVTLTDAAGAPVEATSVYMDFTMPQMIMGVNQPIADRIGPGRYGVRTIYSMEGDWRITIVASINGREVRANFDHPVSLP